MTMRAAVNGVRRYQLILGALFAIAAAVFLLVIYHLGIDTEVMVVYFPYADELMGGSIPDIEYPPLALAFLAIPRLFSSTPFGYEIGFVIMTVVFFLIGLVVIGKLAKRYNQSQHQAMLVYTVLMLLMLEFVLDRYDIFPAIITLLSFYCLVTKRYTWAFLLLSIATMTKLYPAVLFPIYLIPFILNRDWTNAVKGTGAFVIVALLVALPIFLSGSDMITNFIEYHMDRPLHVESTVASFIALAAMLGLTSVWTTFSYGSDNLMGAWPDAVAPYLTPLMLISLFFVYGMYAYMLVRLRRERRDNENNRMIMLSGAVLLSLLLFIMVGKVFSAQYLIWVIPFIVFMLMTSIDHTHKNYVLVLSIAAIALTQLDFVVNVGISGGGDAITDVGMLIILARNLVVIALTVYVIWVNNKHIQKKHWKASAD